MQPPEKRPAAGFDATETTLFEAVRPAAIQRNAPAVAVPAASRKLARMLLPGERVTFGSTPHPLVFAQPALALAAIAIGLAAASATLHGVGREVALAAGAALLAADGLLLVRRALRFAGLRVVTTNRRAFAIRGVVVRRIRPLANTALAGSTVSQGVLGRWCGIGSLHLPQPDGTTETFRDMRDALQLYREFQAVAHGVDGDDWQPAVRQTIIP